MSLIALPILAAISSHLFVLVSAKGGGGGGGRGGGGGGRGGGKIKGVAVGGGGGEADPVTIGIIIGSIVGAIILFILCVWLYKRHQKKKKAKKAATAAVTKPEDADLEAGKTETNDSKTEELIPAPVSAPVLAPKPVMQSWKAALLFAMSRKPRQENNNSLTVPQSHDDNVALLGRRESFTSESKHHSTISRSSSPSNSSISGGHSPTRQSFERPMPRLSYEPPSGPPPNYSPNQFSMPMPTMPHSGSHLQMPSPGYY